LQLDPGTLLDPPLVGVMQWVVNKLMGFFGEGGCQTFTNQDAFLKSSLDEFSPRGGVERQSILKPLFFAHDSMSPRDHACGAEWWRSTSSRPWTFNTEHGSFYYLSSRPPKPRRVLTD